jgi:hypothetical protein
MFPDIPECSLHAHVPVCMVMAPAGKLSGDRADMSLWSNFHNAVHMYYFFAGGGVKMNELRRCFRQKYRNIQNQSF